MFSVEQEPVEPEVGEQLGYVRVADANEGPDDGLALFQLFFKGVFQCLTPVSVILFVWISVIIRLY